MNPGLLIHALDRFTTALPAVVAGVSADDARWKPADGAWSILEVVSHLLDEEVRDFRTRIRMTLQQPGEPWPAIDPEGWAVAERYNDRDLPAVTQQWAAERRASVAWLRSLGDVDWSIAYQHPHFGSIHAGDLLASWAAHDALHLRQIAKRLYQIAGRDGGAYATVYAGEWRA